MFGLASLANQVQWEWMMRRAYVLVTTAVLACELVAAGIPLSAQQRVGTSPATQKARTTPKVDVDDPLSRSDNRVVPTAPLLGRIGAPAGSPAARAESLSFVGDTSRALALLDSAVRANKQDGTSWYLLGRLQWELARSARRAGFMRSQLAILRLIGADSSLRLATQMAPDSARYWLTLAYFSRQSGLSTMRFGAQGQIARTIEAATRSGDHRLLAQAYELDGTTHWSSYETSHDRAFNMSGLSPFALLAELDARNVVDRVRRQFPKALPPTGFTDWATALDRFEKAVQFDSTSQRNSRRLYMGLIERGQWGEVAAIAAMRARQYPTDYQSQLALGMSLFRLDRPREAKRAFDSAAVLMDDAEYDRLTQLTRVLMPRGSGKDGPVKDAESFRRLSPQEQRTMRDLYWTVNDPVVLTDENEFLLEFLTRVTFADFRWSDEDIGYRGADTDRGDVYVRYGPPDEQLIIGGGEGFRPTLVWLYNSGRAFFFPLVPGFGTSIGVARAANNNLPVTWTNVEATKQLDTIPVLVSRFRTASDSTDAVIAARVSTDSLLRDVPITPAPVDIGLRIIDQYVRPSAVDVRRVELRPDSAPPGLPQQWTRRLGPGINVVRVEALQADTRRAARSTQVLDAFTTTGPGMSDLLIGTPPAARALADVPQRWRDVAITPSAGVYERGSCVGLLWELYELATREGASRYRVTIGVQRVERTGFGGFALRVLDGVGRAVSGEQRGQNRIDVSFEQRVPAAPTHVESLALDLRTSPAGRYRLQVRIDDLLSGQRHARTTEFMIR